MRVLSALLLCAALFTGMAARAADHREAPQVDTDPVADLNDVYLFRDPADSNFIIMALTTNPFSSPSTPTAHQFAPDVLYRFNIDLNGDAIADTSISFAFTPFVPAPQLFAAALPGGIVVTGTCTLPTVGKVPNDPVIVNGPQGIQIFAGPRDDPFFFDGVGFNRLLAGGGTAAFRGIDSFAAANVSAVVVRLPISLVRPTSGNTIGVWATTYRLSRPQLGAVAAQVDRTGVPALNTAFIPAAMKDAFNLGDPINDARDFGPAIVAALNRFGTNAANQQILGSVAIPDILKIDLTRPDGFPNGRRLQDDVIDTLLTLILNGPAGDGVNGNDQPFLTTFPYMAPPLQAP